MIKRVSALGLCAALVLTIGFPFDNPLSTDRSSRLKLGAIVDTVKAVTLSDSDVKSIAKQFATVSDRESRIADQSSPYHKRLIGLVNNHYSEDGLDLNFKVYIDPEVNAFALADGSIRVNSGLMDLMSDSELLAVIGHEIGHVKEGHSKSQIKTAYATSAAVKAGGAAVGGQGAGIQLGTAVASNLLKDVLDAQFSQSQETSADDYGFGFLKKHNYNQQGAVTALRKLGSGGGGLMSSHPSSESRALRIEKKID